MKALRNYRPDLRACELEDRFVPAIPNFGVITLTTDGYVLISAFPGLPAETSGLVASIANSNMGAGVMANYGDTLITAFSGFATDPFSSLGGPSLTSLGITISKAISGLQPANSTGVPGLATTAPTGSSGGAAATVIVGSGADDAGAANIPPVTRNTIANDALSAAPIIGQLSGDRSSVLPPDQIYRGGLPVTATVGFSPELPGQRAAQEPAQGPVHPLPLRLSGRPHPLASGASGNLIRSHADRVP